jgi:hypothetical protein
MIRVESQRCISPVNQNYPTGDAMKLCYCDESGTGDEPIAVMVGVLVDSQRMHITKQDWNGLLVHLSNVANRQITELHTRDFYAGNGVFRD